MTNKDPELLPCQVSDAVLNAAREAGPPILRGVADCELTEILDAAITAMTTASTIPTDAVEQVSEAIYDFLDERFPEGAMPGGQQLFASDHLDAEFKHEAGCDEMAKFILARLSTIPSAGDGELATAADGLDLVSSALQEVHALSREGVADGTYDAHMMGQIAAVERGASLLRRAALSIQTISGKGMREALVKCRDKFREYEGLHTQKLRDYKGKEPLNYAAELQFKIYRNREMAEMCDAALVDQGERG
jgi:hypothetical protein